ncbi:hypothetical protein FIBSPDRAFT_822040 [Athelia psychrophila]|uniref:Uncharacterized protein n=1 Tax=Athelia psychrophila TaxID=1759441 RepID=A0A166N696_9AGAM|nr:hypothetical protein FIBSPDRAFT_822040 [Fibularhizoctonia sp. CBS 109695]
MPRILTSLQRQLEKVSSTSKRRRTAVKSVQASLIRPALPAPSFSAAGRTQSILLDDVNPIINADVYTHHKAIPPAIQRQKRVIRGFDHPRVMTEHERGRWASPYLRMLSSPLRTCIVTSRTLPSDFLVRLAPMRLPTPRTGREAQSLLPDGIEHPKFKSRRAYVGVNIMCCHSAIDVLAERGHYRRFAPNVSLHSRLKEQIGHLLRVRALQELELLAERLQANPHGAEETTLIRKLTRAEWQSIGSTGNIPYKNAVAVVVVPPVNRDPVSKARPEPSTSADAPAQTTTTPTNAGTSFRRPTPPLSVLHPVTEPPIYGDILADRLPSSKVPLYNGVSLFPSRPQRAALYASLNALLSIERRARYQEHGRPDQPTKDRKEDPWTRGDKKASHAFLLCADEKTANRADMTAVAIALWRIRMWEGAGWEDRGSESDGWQLNP